MLLDMRRIKMIIIYSGNLKKFFYACDCLLVWLFLPIFCDTFLSIIYVNEVYSRKCGLKISSLCR